MSRRYRPRVFARVPFPGCCGCSVPLIVLAVVLAVYVGVLLAGLAL